MIQQMQQPCNECRATGETISDKDRCGQCKGEKVVQEKKVVEVVVEKGMQHSQKITFPGEADEAVCAVGLQYQVFMLVCACLRN
jgi:DnaJ family protein A protein 2